jgi:hypothetical protein
MRSRPGSAWSSIPPRTEEGRNLRFGPLLFGASPSGEDLCRADVLDQRGHVLDVAAGRDADLRGVGDERRGVGGVADPGLAEVAGRGSRRAVADIGIAGRLQFGGPPAFGVQRGDQGRGLVGRGLAGVGLQRADIEIRDRDVAGGEVSSAAPWIRPSAASSCWPLQAGWLAVWPGVCASPRRSRRGTTSSGSPCRWGSDRRSSDR